jgi:hypothetical protein
MEMIIKFSRKSVTGATYRGIGGNGGGEWSGRPGWLSPRDGKMNILNEIIRFSALNKF